MITLYYESRFGLARGVICYDGLPHLYAEGLETDPSLAVLGARSLARLTGRAGDVLFLELADGGEAILDIPPEAAAKLSDGVAVEIEIAAEARRDKRARARLIRVATGETPQRLSEPASLKDRLKARAGAVFGDTPRVESQDEDALDEAEAQALDPSGDLPGGGYLSIERTRALIACDVDTAGGGEGLARTPRNFARQCNEAAVRDVPRRLRLSGLAGLVIIDLIGKRHDADRLRQLLSAACAPEAVSIGAVGKFGTLEFVRPWSATPLCDAPLPLRAAHHLLREAARRAEGERGRLLTLRAPPGVLDIVRPLIAASHDPLKALMRLEAGNSPEVIVL